MNKKTLKQVLAAQSAEIKELQYEIAELRLSFIRMDNEMKEALYQDKHSLGGIPPQLVG